MTALIAILLVVVVVLVVGGWWRYRSLACPAALSWLLENPYMRALAGPELLIRRIALKPGMRLLDIGCGPGRLALPAARRVGPAGTVLGLDIQPRMLAKLAVRVQAAGLGNVEWVRAGAGEGALPTGAFDRALLVTVLGEIPDQPRALKEIYRALRPGGLLSVTELIPDPHYQRRSRVRALCRAAGFDEAEAFGNWWAFTLNFRRPQRP